MASDALTPNRSALLQFAREVEAERNRDSDSLLDRDDVELNLLREMPGWQVLVKLIESRKESLKPKFDFKTADDNEFFKSYGMRSVIFDIIADELNWIVRRVDHAGDVVRESRTGK